MRRLPLMLGAGLGASLGVCLVAGSGASPALAQGVPAPTQTSQPWRNAQLSPDLRATLLDQAMSDDERIALLHGPFAWTFNGNKLPDGAIGSAGFIPGNARLGIPALQEADAGLGVTNPMGLRMGVHAEQGATALPSGPMLAATFDPALAYRAGAVLGAEAHAKGFNVQLAAGANLMRDPRNGRTFEYLSEDPLLTGRMAGQTIRGVQDQHVVSTIKHFSLNAQETGRHFANAIIEEGAHRESDLLAFEIAIETGRPGSVMCAYNLVNSDYACSNDHLLNGVLKGDWHYSGWVMSDWGAVHGVADAIKGLDQQSGEQIDPQVYFGAPLKAAVVAGTVPSARLHDMAKRVLRSMFAVGLFDDPAKPAPIDYDRNAQAAKAVAEEGIVLLKNRGDVLPLARKVKTIAVIGGHAEAGVLSGGGSSQVVGPGGGYTVVPIGGEGRTAPWRNMLFHPSSPLAAIRAQAPDAQVRFYDGRYPAAAARLAAQSDIAIVFATQWSSEGEDVPNLSLPEGQDALIEQVAAANPKTIVVLETSGPVVMPWLDHVPAVIEAWYSGARGGEAIADVLFGTVSPSGRLPFTFPADVAQYPRVATPGLGLPDKVRFDVPYSEGADVGYRHFAKTSDKPLFPFGHGLSYSRFDYGRLSVTGGQRLTIRFDVTNTGTVAAKDTPQVYLTRRGDTPIERLIGFDKVSLKPGETRSVELVADPRLLGDFDVARHRWALPAGLYQVTLARSADAPVASAQARLAASTLAP